MAAAEVAAVHQGMGDDPGAGSDGHGVLAGQGGAHAAVGGHAGQAAVIELEQQSGRDVMHVSGQRERAELVVAVERLACGVQAAEQARQARDQAGVPACLVLPPGVARGGGQCRDIECGFQFCRVRCMPGEHGRQSLGIGWRAGPRDAVEYRADHCCAGEPDEGPASHWVVLLPVLFIEGKQAGGRVGRGVPRGQAEVDPGGVGQAEAIGDPLEHVELLDLLDAAHDVADLALGQHACDADLGLAGPGVLLHESEEPSDVPVAQGRDGLGPLPERGRDLDQVVGAAGHAVARPPSAVPVRGCCVTDCELISRRGIPR